MATEKDIINQIMNDLKDKPVEFQREVLSLLEDMNTEGSAEQKEAADE
ncbi:MAG: hypothetical protein Q4C55_02385 [Eubacterium sp.]|nr:hypothetical protein [Eubacterium sp.]